MIHTEINEIVAQALKANNKATDMCLHGIKKLNRSVRGRNILTTIVFVSLLVTCTTLTKQFAAQSGKVAELENRLQDMETSQLNKGD